MSSRVNGEPCSVQLTPSLRDIFPGVPGTEAIRVVKVPEILKPVVKLDENLSLERVAEKSTGATARRKP